MAKMTAEKKKAYGDSLRKSGELLKIIYPDGISHEQMTTALINVRIIDKLNRIANEPSAFGENPYEDIIGYALRGAEILEEAGKGEK